MSAVTSEIFAAVQRDEDGQATGFVEIRTVTMDGKKPIPAVAAVLTWQQSAHLIGTLATCLEDSLTELKARPNREL